jgi:hypothetical protein
MALNVLGLVFSSIAWIAFLILEILFLSLPGHAFEAVLAVLWFAAFSVAIAAFALKIYDERKLQQEEIEENRIREEKRRLRNAEIEENRRREEEQRIKEEEIKASDQRLRELRRENKVKSDDAFAFTQLTYGGLVCPCCGQIFRPTVCKDNRAMCPNCWARGKIKEEKENT